MSDLSEEIKKTQDKWTSDYNKYVEIIEQSNNIIAQQSNKFNSLITVINVERHLMRREINSLYRFLQQFGNIGEKITLFDYTAEDWLFSDSKETIDSKNNKESSFLTTSSVEKIVNNALISNAVIMAGSQIASLGISSTSILTFAPIISPITSLAAPVLGIGGLALNKFKKSQDKKELAKIQNDYQDEKIKMDKDIREARARTAHISNLVEIADLYRVTIAIIRDTISDTIIPEMNGIQSFIYADSLKNCIINGDNPYDFQIANISEYKDTAYDCHYTFIKNAFNFYKLTTEIFKEPILSSLCETEQITEKEYKVNELRLDSLRIACGKIKSISTFGGNE